MQASAIETTYSNFVNVGSGIEKALGPQEVPGSCTSIEGQSQYPHERVNRVIAVGAVVSKVTVPTFAPKSVMCGDSFEQGGLASAVLSRKQTDSCAQI